MKDFIQIREVLGQQRLVQAILRTNFLNDFGIGRLQAKVFVLADDVHHRIARHEANQHKVDGDDAEDDEQRLQQAHAQSPNMHNKPPLPRERENVAEPMQRPDPQHIPGA